MQSCTKAGEYAQKHTDMNTQLYAIMYKQPRVVCLVWYAIHPHRLIMSYARLFCPPPSLASIQCFHRRPTLFLGEENVFISKSLFFSVRKKQGVTTICAGCAKNFKVVRMIHSLQHTQVHISLFQCEECEHNLAVFLELRICTNV